MFSKEPGGILATGWRAVKSGPFFDIEGPPAEFLDGLPEDYRTLAAEFGGKEGFLGQTYLRLYRVQELVSLNAAYDVPKLLPEVIIFGSNAGGEAFAFSIGESCVLQVPFIPLIGDQCVQLAQSFSEFVGKLAASGTSPDCNPQIVGMEIHEIHPICLGGSPTDPANKVLIPPVKHAEVARFWNKVYRDALAKERG